jgi:hypothetical protein
MHSVPFIGHPWYHKTIVAIRGQYFWINMKKYVADCIARCMECQKVKSKNKHIVGLLQPFPNHEWKCAFVTIDFIANILRIERKHDFIMVVVENIIKDANLIPVKMTRKAANIVEIYIKESSMLHGVII